MGVADPVLHHELDGDPGFDMYRPYTQSSTAGPHYVIRTAGDPMSIAREATAIIANIDPNQSFLDVQSYDQRVANRIWQRRVAGALFGAFAMLALLLAAVGLYGVLSYAVTQQTREIGIRVTLGATSGEINRLIISRGLALTGIGVGAGLALTVALSRFLGERAVRGEPARSADIPDHSTRALWNRRTRLLRTGSARVTRRSDGCLADPVRLAFNVSSWANFAALVASLADSRFGRIGQTRSGTNPTQLQLGLRMTF